MPIPQVTTVQELITELQKHSPTTKVTVTQSISINRANIKPIDVYGPYMNTYDNTKIIILSTS